MAVPSIQTAFIAGEVSPSLWGRTDLARFHIGASTMRNFFVDYRGGASSRAGLAFVGQCKQSGLSPNPPRDIPFQFSVTQGYVLEFGNFYMRVKAAGAYVTEDPVVITGITNGDPALVTSPAHPFATGDWVYLAGVGGMTEINNQTYLVGNVTTNTYQLLRTLDGAPVDASLYGTYTSGGTASRIYTITTPYADTDLRYLKFTQSADVMSVCCLNQETGTEYYPYELSRLGNAAWSLGPATFAASVVAPISASATASTTTSSDSTSYQYKVTAISLTASEESIASNVATVTNSVDIALTAGSISVSWKPVTGASSYNVYKAPEGYKIPVAAGAIFGYAGTALGIQFNDNNITADFTRAPPTHDNPFAAGAVTGLLAVSAGTSYTASPTITITSSTGAGAVITPVIVNGGLQAFIVENGGSGYSSSDTVTITGGTTGATASATLVVGPISGTYPGCVAYFQQRRVYASTMNEPDTYWMSRPGSFNNFDSSIPAVDSDSISGTPWSQQVNGIQAMINMPGGLVVLTGLGAWQVSGGSQTAAITPANQTATPQAYNGCHQNLPPIAINYDILYIQQKGSIVRDLAYNFFVNIYTGTDMTLISNHLFANRRLVSWGWAEEPFKIVWCVRDDGVMLSFTFLKEQDIYGWARHDTNGLFKNICVISEGAVNAPYAIVRRFIRGANEGAGTWAYYSERMDNRLWENVEQAWCVDSGLAYPMAFPDAELTASTATGDSGIGSVTVVYGGSGYVAPVGTVIDASGSGEGATVTLAVSGGAITSVTVTARGAGYTPGATTILISDPTATITAPAVLQPVITNPVSLTTNVDAFTAANVGDVVRVGGGIMTVTAFVGTTEVTADITQAITATIPNDPLNRPAPAESGDWSVATPTDTINGLWHLEGMEAAILADGSVVPNQIVTNGQIILPHPASAIVIGLPFLPQLQTLYLDAPSQVTQQGRRKRVFAVTARVQNTRGLTFGANQVDASTQPNQANIQWGTAHAGKLIEVKERNALINAGRPIQLLTMDERVNIPGTWQKPAQISFQQNYPLPATILAAIPETVTGDDPG